MSPTVEPATLVRAGRPGDEPALSALIRRQALATYRDGDPRLVAAWAARAYAPAAIRARIDSADAFLLVSEDADGALLGTACAELRRGPCGCDAVLGGTYLSPAARGRGLTVEFDRLVVAWLKARGARRVLAWVHAENLRARRLLEVVGFAHRADVPGALVPGMLWSLMTAEVAER